MPPESAFSRRDFFTGALFRRRAESVTPPPAPRARPLLRPPGAGAELTFLSRCTQCGECLIACPHRALFMAPAAYGKAAGTPMLDPVEQPCWMCTDTPCITVCVPGALERSDAGSFPVIGKAEIHPTACLGFQGVTCTTCIERCPSPGALSLESGRPVLQEDRCTGCGVCVEACPVPGKAISIRPVEQPAPSVPLGL